MAASTSDKITDTRNAARPVSARVSTARTAGDTILVCNGLSGWPTASKVHGVTYQIDTNSNPVEGTQIDFSAIVSGSNLASFTVVDGTDNGNAINDVVEMLPTAAWGQDLSDALMASHDRDGTLKDGAVDSADVLAADVVTTAKILNSNVTTAKIADNAVTAAKLDGVDKSLLSTDSNPYKFSVYQASNQGTASSTWTTLNMGAEDFDTNNNVSGGTYTVPVSGFYQLNGQSGTEGSPGQIQGWGVRLIKNGSGTTPLTGSYWYDNGVSYDASREQVSCLVQLTAGDTVTIQGWMAGTASMLAGRHMCNFSGFLVCRT